MSSLTAGGIQRIVDGHARAADLASDITTFEEELDELLYNTIGIPRQTNPVTGIDGSSASVLVATLVNIPTDIVPSLLDATRKQGWLLRQSTTNFAYSPGNSRMEQHDNVLFVYKRRASTLWQLVKRTSRLSSCCQCATQVLLLLVVLTGIAFLLSLKI